MDENPLLLTDSYKVTHWRQYPPGTERVYSYLESRGGRFDEVVFFGLQYLLLRHLCGAVVTPERIEEADAFFAAHFGDAGLFHRAGWEHIARAHGGRLPLRIKAVPEGTPVPTRNVLLTVENTDPACYWLTSYVETLLVQVWYPCTVATLARELKRLIGGFLARTGDPTGVETRVHDFGFRGVSSVESAALGGAAHLVSFAGGDTLAACVLARDYYGAGMAGHSIPAAEHSTITTWGRDHELAAYRHLLAQFPSGVVSCVSDSYDVFAACADLWGGPLRDAVLGRAGTLVVRPDSGDPPEVVARVLELLGSRFGSSVNAKGYRVLPPQIRVIQGDAVDYEMARAILARLEARGWSADNVSFGMGGALLQRLDRDTQQFAFKCSAVTVRGAARDVFKEPVTDAGKTSKRGRLRLVREGGAFRTEADAPGAPDALVEVFRDGALRVRSDFDAIRARAALPPPPASR